MKYFIPPQMLRAFVEHGLVPAGCSNLNIELPASGVLALHYTVYLQPEHMPKLAAAFTQIHELLLAGQPKAADGSAAAEVTTDADR
jgi:hypothetical protein